MSDERYFKVEYDEEWYLFDSTTISKQLVEEQAEYGYGVFANSLSPSVVVNFMNEQQDKITELEIELTDCKNRKEQSEYNLRRENELLKKDNQRQKTLRNKHWREIQARANAYNRIISSLEDIIPQPMIEELRNAPLLDCDYEGVESNE